MHNNQRHELLFWQVDRVYQVIPYIFVGNFRVHLISRFSRMPKPSQLIIFRVTKFSRYFSNRGGGGGGGGGGKAKPRGLWRHDNVTNGKPL